MKKAIQVFIIIGCVATSISTYGIGLTWTLPMTIILMKKIKNNDDISIAWKVCTLLFLSHISGIMMLCYNSEEKTTSKIARDDGTTYEKSKITLNTLEQDKIELLKQYKELLDSNIISQEEFETKKDELLNH